MTKRNPHGRGGRPKGSPNRKTIVQKVAREKHSVNTSGDTKELQLATAIIQIVQYKAMTGDLRAVQLRDQYLTQYLEPPTGKDTNAVIVVPEQLSAAESIKQAQARNDKMDQIQQEVLAEMRGILR